MKKIGLPLHLILTISLVVLLFGKLLPEINQTYFSRMGDGFRTYYGMYFHAKYDKTAHRLDGMNYPYGEIINFTDCQPPVANLIRFISMNIVDISSYTPAINNFLMIFSLVLASLFLFLIFRFFKIPWWYASLVSLGIVFLSPQIQRMGGHFSLAWMFWIPLSVYLLLLFDRKPSWLLSALVAFSAWLAGDMHFYFLAFWLFLFLPYWLYRWFLSKEYHFKRSDLIHCFIQVMLPFLVLQLTLILNDSATDRTANPWGFYDFRGRFIAVFLPLFKSYVPFLNDWGFAKRVTWEAFSYIGLVASAGFFVLVRRWFTHTLKVKKRVSLTGDPRTDFLMVVSILVLLFSFGIPFILGLDKLRSLAGPLGQLRGVARFGWMFYYVVNIVVFRQIYLNWFEGRRAVWLKTLALMSVGFLLFEAWSYSSKYQYQLNNKMEELNTTNPESLASVVQATIEAERFQAVLPLPYFNVGSESTWIQDDCDIMKHTFVVSMLTGLPNIGVMAARTSISQAYKNTALSSMPWKRYPVLDDYPNNKPLLLTVAKCETFTEDELRLVSHARHLGGTAQLDLYELDLDTLKSIPEKYRFPERYALTTDSIQHLMTDSLAYFSANGGKHTEEKLVGVEASHNFNRIMEAPVVIDPGKPLYLRFWVRDYARDLVARTQLLVIQSAPDHQTLEEKYSDIFRHIRSFDGDWALIEIELQAKQEREIIKLLFKNYNIEGQRLFFDEWSVSQLKL